MCILSDGNGDDNVVLCEVLELMMKECDDVVEKA